MYYWSSADYLIIDDPYKGFTDITPTYLQKRKDWFQTIIEPRLRKETKLLILHTRWHSEDIIGFLKENYFDDYTFLSYPAIDENNNPLWHINSLDWYMKKKENMGENVRCTISATTIRFNQSILFYGKLEVGNKF